MYINLTLIIIHHNYFSFILFHLHSFRITLDWQRCLS